MEVYSLIAFKDDSSPPDISRAEIINIWAAWDLVEGLASLVLIKYPEADRVIAVNGDGIQMGEWFNRLVK